MSKVDRTRVDEKAAYIREQVTDLRRLSSERPLEAFLADGWLVRGVKYTLQTAIEAVIDISYHVCAKALAYAPIDGRDAVRKLGECGIIPGDAVTTYQAMIGFRNRIVHGYERVSNERVYHAATAELDDFEAFLVHIYRYLNRP